MASTARGVPVRLRARPCRPRPGLTADQRPAVRRTEAFDRADHADETPAADRPALPRRRLHRDARRHRGARRPRTAASAPATGEHVDVAMAAVMPRSTNASTSTCPSVQLGAERADPRRDRLSVLRRSPRATDRHLPFSLVGYADVPVLPRRDATPRPRRRPAVRHPGGASSPTATSCTGRPDLDFDVRRHGVAGRPVRRLFSYSPRHRGPRLVATDRQIWRGDLRAAVARSDQRKLCTR